MTKTALIMLAFASSLIECNHIKKNTEKAALEAKLQTSALLSVRLNKHEFINREPIEIIISNNTSAKVFYYVGLELFVKDRWQEIDLDIQSEIMKTVTISNISSHDNITLLYKTLFPLEHKGVVKCRFKVVSGRSLEMLDSTSFSKEFATKTL